MNVAPYTGAWIEIAWLSEQELSDEVAPYTGAWIEIQWKRIERVHR